VPNRRGCRQIHRTLEREPGAAAEARRELERFEDDLDEVDLEISALLLSELVANSVRHAGEDAGPRVYLDITLTGDRLRVEVRDGGPGFVPVRRRPGDIRSLHWGMELVSRLADRWQVVSGNGSGETLVWFELDRGQARLREAEEEEEEQELSAG
jgi:anti-sigma regulatory factor (Ser/Thr protein kinase)